MDWISLFLIPAIKSVLLVVVLLTGFAYLSYIERKLVARFQADLVEAALLVPS